VYRLCIASFDPKLWGKGPAILGTKHQDDCEPYWLGEKDWLCTVEFLPTDDPEARLSAASIVHRSQLLCRLFLNISRVLRNAYLVPSLFISAVNSRVYR
jgi:hypothetical protein